MSRRHEGNGRSATLKKDDRLAEHRRDRRVARQQMGLVEPDDAVLPGEAHGHLHAHRPTKQEPKRVRHWKLPFWKRRNNVRAERAMAERMLNEED
ncbi:MAG: hypothetical protein ACRDY7_13960 [Acidimicrobiia bacterium]